MSRKTEAQLGDRKSRAGAVTATERTRERIREAALCLFNAQGTAAVSTNHIATEAGLSVGNLYYHYKSKEEIIRAIYDRMAEEWSGVFALPEKRLPTSEDLERMLRDNYEMLWRYRFFYRELVALLHRDEPLAAHFQEVRKRGFDNFKALMQAFAASGVLRPIPDAAELECLALNCWLVSEFFLPFLEAGGETISPAHIEKGVALLRHALAPYRPA